MFDLVLRLYLAESILNLLRQVELIITSGEFPPFPPHLFRAYFFAYLPGKFRNRSRSVVSFIRLVLCTSFKFIVNILKNKECVTE